MNYILEVFHPNVLSSTADGTFHLKFSEFATIFGPTSFVYWTVNIPLNIPYVKKTFHNNIQWTMLISTASTNGDNTFRHRHRQTDRQTDRQTQTDRSFPTLMNRLANQQVLKWSSERIIHWWIIPAIGCLVRTDFFRMFYVTAFATALHWKWQIPMIKKIPIHLKSSECTQKEKKEEWNHISVWTGCYWNTEREAGRIKMEEANRQRKKRNPCP